jgi:hypothetical protein
VLGHQSGGGAGHLARHIGTSAFVEIRQHLCKKGVGRTLKDPGMTSIWPLAKKQEVLQGGGGSHW